MHVCIHIYIYIYIYLRAEDMKFSAAHFVAFKGFREPVHGQYIYDMYV